MVIVVNMSNNETMLLSKLLLLNGIKALIRNLIEAIAIGICKNIFTLDNFLYFVLIINNIKRPENPEVKYKK